MGVYRNSLIAAMSIFLVLDTIVVAARVYVRIIMIRGFGYDDASLCLAYLGYIIACAMGFTSMHYGYAAEGDDQMPYYDSGKTQTFYYANQVSLYISSGIVKLAVALVLYRLATNRPLQVILITSMVVVLIWSIVMTLFSAWLCAASGASDYIGSHTCTVVGYFRMVSNIFIDYFFAFFPILILWNSRMSFKVKLSVYSLLGLGMFASAATIAKLVILIQLGHAKGLEVADLHYQLLIWADVELGLSIFCASAAALRPLLRQFSSIWGTTKNQTSDGVSIDASISCHPLSRTDQELSSHRSGSERPEGLAEYELSRMSSNKTDDHQDHQRPGSHQQQVSPL